MPNDPTGLGDPFAPRKTDESASSLRPVEVEVESFDDLDREAGIFDLLTPELAARRARMRRIVAGIVAVAGLVGVLGAVRVARKHAGPADAGSSILAAQPAVASVEVVAELPSPPPAPPAMADPVEPAAEPTPEPLAVPVEAKRDAAAFTPSVRETKKQARLAIAEGRYDEAIALGRAVVNLDPTDAAGYLLLGGALQEAGQWDRAARAFSRCATRAKRGAVEECRALAER